MNVTTYICTQGVSTCAKWHLEGVGGRLAEYMYNTPIRRRGRSGGVWGTRHVDGRVSNKTSFLRSSSGRYNESLDIHVPLDALYRPFAVGNFCWLAKGVYTWGPRRRDACVVKWLKSGTGFGAACFTDDIKMVKLALMSVEEFNQLNPENKIKVKRP